MIISKILAACLLIQAVQANRIVYANHGQFPYHVSIKKDTGKESYNHVCSGAIIADEFVLTAANCVHGVNPSKFLVMAGDTDCTSSSGGQTAPVSRIFLNKKYLTNTTDFYKEHDIAIVKLGKKLTFNNNVNYVRLPKYKQNFDNARDLTITAFVFSKSNFKTNLLKFFKATVLEPDYCLFLLNNARPRAKVFNSTQYCIDEELYSSFAVKGDSGSPTVQIRGKDVVLVALAAAYATKVSDNRDLTISTKVSLYVNWINKIIGVDNNGASIVTYGYLVLVFPVIIAVNNMS